jgi:hypothetical protein
MLTLEVAGKIRVVDLELRGPDRLYTDEVREINKQVISQIMDQATITDEELEFINRVNRWSSEGYLGSF